MGDSSDKGTKPEKDAPVEPTVADEPTVEEAPAEEQPQTKPAPKPRGKAAPKPQRRGVVKPRFTVRKGDVVLIDGVEEKVRSVHGNGVVSVESDVERPPLLYSPAEYEIVEG